MKFILLLILGLCSFQRFETRTIVELQKTKDIIDDITEMINKFVKLMQDIVRKMETITKDFTKRINAIQDAASLVNGNITQLIEETDNKIKDITNSGDKGKQCVEKHQQDIDDWTKTTYDNIENCAANAQAVLEKIDSVIQNWKNNTSDFIRNTQQIVTDCEHEETSENILACLQSQYSPATARYNELNQSGVDVITIIVIQGDATVDNFQQCAQKTINDATNQATNLIKTINDCVAH